MKLMICLAVLCSSTACGRYGFETIGEGVDADDTSDVGDAGDVGDHGGGEGPAIDGGDLCPSDPLKTDPGACGCGVADTDADQDGVVDCVDACFGRNAVGDEDDDGYCGCEEPSAFADDFEDGTIGAGWWEWATSRATILETGGAAVLTFPANDPGAVGLSAVQALPAENESVWVEIAEIEDARITPYVVAGDIDGDSVAARVDGTELVLDSFIGGTPSRHLSGVAYVPSEHRFLRFTFAANQTSFQTSADGGSWTHQGTVPWAPVYMRADLGAEVVQAMTSSASVRFGSFNVGQGAPSPRIGARIPCPIDTLVDSFDAGRLSYLWVAWVNGGAPVEVGGGRLRIPLLAGVTGDAYSGVTSQRIYDLTGRRIFIEAAGPPVDPNAELAFEIGHVVGTVAQIDVFGDTIEFVEDTREQLPFDRAQHRFWAFREELGILHLETSPDARSWTIQRSLTVAEPLIDMHVVFYGGSWSPLATPEVVELDNLNLTP